MQAIVEELATKVDELDKVFPKPGEKLLTMTEQVYRQIKAKEDDPGYIEQPGSSSMLQSSMISATQNNSAFVKDNRTARDMLQGSEPVPEKKMAYVALDISQQAKSDIQVYKSQAMEFQNRVTLHRKVSPLTAPPKK
jgi:hypothetical protein